jgi:hypothetical protein
VKKLLWKLVGASNYAKLRNTYQLFVEKHLLGNWKVYHSQMGEDMILKNLFQNKENGFYIDIGAYHPVELSNTYYFYKKGWRGINVDATPGSMKIFRSLRRDDINLEMGVADNDCERDYYLFHSKTLNTFTQEGLKYVKNQFNAEPYRVMKIKFMTLEKLLDTYLPSTVTQIDFLNVDVEGADELVIRSNNWNKYKPKVICIERHMNYNEFKETQLCKFLEDKGYNFAAKSGPSYFYYSNSF